MGYRKGNQPQDLGPDSLAQSVSVGQRPPFSTRFSAASSRLGPGDQVMVDYPGSSIFKPDKPYTVIRLIDDPKRGFTLVEIFEEGYHAARRALPIQYLRKIGEENMATQPGKVVMEDGHEIKVSSLKSVIAELTKVEKTLAQAGADKRAILAKAKDGGLDPEAVKAVMKRKNKKQGELDIFGDRVVEYERLLGWRNEDGSAIEEEEEEEPTKADVPAAAAPQKPNGNGHAKNGGAKHKTKPAKKTKVSPAAGRGAQSTADFRSKFN